VNKKARKTQKLVGTVPNYNKKYRRNRGKNVTPNTHWNKHFKESKPDPNKDGFMYAPGVPKSTSGPVSN
jgi:hypothetical protein